MTLCGALEAAQIVCWIAPRDIPAGKRWDEAIMEAIRETRCMVLLLSASANSSVQVLHEVERAASYGLRIFPVRIEDVQPTGGLELHISGPQWINAFPKLTSEHLNVLLEALKGRATWRSITSSSHLVPRRGRGSSIIVLIASLVAIGVVAAGVHFWLTRPTPQPHSSRVQAPTVQPIHVGNGISDSITVRSNTPGKVIGSN